MQVALKLKPLCTYHLGFSGNNGERIFLKHEDYERYLATLLVRCGPVFQLWVHNCLGNHAHHAATVREYVWDMTRNCETDVRVTSKMASQAISNFLNGYAKYFNLAHDRSGTLFRKIFWRDQIETNERLINVIRYIHNNAVHHGFVDRVEDWPYSSHSFYGAAVPNWLNPDPVYGLFGGRKAFFEMSSTPLTELECRGLFIGEWDDYPSPPLMLPRGQRAS